jgi:hypothetical protein
MRSYNKKKLIFIPFGIVAISALIGFVVMTLWNNLLPEILHVGTISFWQALGIFVLCKILFGFGKGGHHGHGMRGGAPWMKRKMEDRFRNMSTEDREKFREKIRNHRCGNKWDDMEWDRFKTEPDKAAE